jgi:hypothetical protein
VQKLQAFQVASCGSSGGDPFIHLHLPLGQHHQAVNVIVARRKHRRIAVALTVVLQSVAQALTVAVARKNAYYSCSPLEAMLVRIL